ncbi:MAG TPA: hypothetical protein VG839_07600 [Asticcacaulis sp.]|nr:hypothetical protein [Asticcacaulis sp.]
MAAHEWFQSGRLYSCLQENEALCASIRFKVRAELGCHSCNAAKRHIRALFVVKTFAATCSKPFVSVRAVRGKNKPAATLAAAGFSKQFNRLGH